MEVLVGIGLLCDLLLRILLLLSGVAFAASCVCDSNDFSDGMELVGEGVISIRDWVWDGVLR